MSDQVSSAVDAPASEAPVSEPTGFEVDQSVVADGMDDVGVDDATLLQQAIAMANGKKEPVQSEAPAKVEVPSEEAPTPVEAKTEEPAKPVAPSADEWEKYFSKQKELEATEAKFKEREGRLADFEKARESRDVGAALKLMGFEDPVAFLHEVAEHGAKPTKERAEILSVKKEIAAIKAERDREVQARQALEQKANNERFIANKRSEIKGFIEKHPALSKGLVTIEGAHDQVLTKIATHFNETHKKTGKGEELSVEKAVAAVETEWEQGIEALARNPKAQEVFKRVMGAVKAAPVKAKPVGVQTLKAPVSQEDPEDLRSVRRGDKEMKEALSWMASRQTARRSS